MKNRIACWLKAVTGDLPPLYLVGGNVRDLLLGRVPNDIDLAASDPEIAARQLADPVGARVVLFDKKPDALCYRVIDRNNPGNTLDICGLAGNSIEADLAGRDFTINAMAIQLDRAGMLGDLLDPLGGKKDLVKNTIRLTSPMALVMDPLRMMRAFRFAAELGFDISKETRNAIRECLHRLPDVAQERIRYELFKILSTPSSCACIREMDSLGLLPVIFPEIMPMKGCTQNSYHHLDVWEHSLAVFANCEHIINSLCEIFGPVAESVQRNLAASPHRIALLKLAALLHDVGKPHTRGRNEKNGRITFYGHDKTGGQIVQEAVRRLKFSNQDGEFLRRLVEEHLHIRAVAQLETRPSTRMRLFRSLGDDLVPLLILGMADINGSLGPDALSSCRKDFIFWAVETAGHYYRHIKKTIEQKDLISGRDLIAMGMKPGPEIGALLKKVREYRDDRMLDNREEALAFAKSAIQSCDNKKGI